MRCKWSTSFFDRLQFSWNSPLEWIWPWTTACTLPSSRSAELALIGPSPLHLTHSSSSAALQPNGSFHFQQQNISELKASSSLVRYLTQSALVVLADDFHFGKFKGSLLTIILDFDGVAVRDGVAIWSSAVWIALSLLAILVNNFSTSACLLALLLSSCSIHSCSFFSKSRFWVILLP